MMILTTLQMSFDDIMQTIREPQVFAAIKLSLSIRNACHLTNLILVRWQLGCLRVMSFGVSPLNALVDLPFALPTAVTGIALCHTLCTQWLVWSMVYTPLGYCCLMSQ